MPSAVRHRLRQFRRGLGYTVAIALVAVALVLAVASRVLPLAESHPDRVAAWLSERAGRPVRFDAVQTEWTRRGPLLQLDNLRIGEGERAFTIGDTEMLVSIYAGLLPDTPFSELRLRGLDLTLERTPDGRWQVRGLPGQRQAGDPLEALEPLGELQVIGGKLAIRAPRLGIDAHIPRIDLRLRVQDGRVRAGVRAWPSEDAVPLDAVLDFDRGSGNGRAWAGARRADLAAWSPLLRLAGIAVDGGRGRAQAWARLRDHRLSMITLDADLRGVGLRSLADDTARVDFPALRGRARWRLVDAGTGKAADHGSRRDWRLDAPELRIDAGDRQYTLDGLVLAGGNRFALLAERLELAPLLAVAGLSDRLSPGVRGWLQQADAHASLLGVEVSGVRGGALHARARIESLGFAPVGDAPGLEGMAGELHGDSEGFSLRFDAATPIRIDWPRGFGVAHTVKVDGTMAGWSQGDGWRVGTAALRIGGDGIGVDARGGLWWQGDGSRPRIDLAADIDATELPVARGFWLHHRMSEKLVQWLDNALVAGHLREARAVVSGDLDDWPFSGRDGRFEARARISGATLRFQPGWPPIEDVDAELAFIADGFSVDGDGRLGQVRIGGLHADIDHYHDGTLRVRARAASDAADLLALLRESPLRATHRDTFDALVASGPAQANFALALPLHPDARTRINGSVILDGARLADKRWDLALEKVSGRARYDRHGFSAPALRISHDGQPGTLSLRAGRGHVDEPGNAFEARLSSMLDVQRLLARAPQLDWLRPHLHGRSAWTAEVEIPAATGAADGARMRLQSDLVGTALELPAPLRKPAASPLASTVALPLPLEDGEIRVSLGERLALRARSGTAGTGVRIALGQSTVTRAPPPSGLVATGKADKLDAIDWIALVREGNEGDEDGGVPLRRIDVSAQRLRLLGGVFPQTRVQVSPAADGGIAVQADGPALAGTLAIEDGPGGRVTGRFARMHWRPAETPAAPTKPASDAAPAEAPVAIEAPEAGAGTAADEGFDPARLPALSLNVEDLRIIDARLGAATLRTRPTAAGLRIEQLRTRFGGDGQARQAIDVTGQWNGRGAAARSALAVRIDSDDLGALLTGLGFAGRLAGGSGTLRLDAGWPGSPADFALASIRGQLTLDARDGRLLEVEPGAGRVLGLLSIAELPRRLTLDFRDFFSTGFAFNTIEGDIRFSGGVARSDDLQIDGPAATIDIRGAADLRARTYDQTIEVRPKTGNLLTVAGALAAGPVGAALGAAANAVLRKPLGDIAATTYQVTGPWQDPRVEVVERETGHAAGSGVEADAAPPAGGTVDPPG